MPLPSRAYDRTLNSELERLLYQIKVVREEADGLLHGLTDSQLNWTPQQGVWSVAQCFDHLNITNTRMIGALEEGIRRGRAAGMLNDGPYSYGFFSRWFFRMAEPPVKRKLAAPKKFQPEPRKSMSELMPAWKLTHDRIEELVRSANGLDLVRVRISSPVVHWVRYSLGAGFWLQTAHDRRHLWQIRQLRNDSRFPA